MAILRSTQVQGTLEVIDNDLYVTGSGKFIHGNLAGTASVAEGLDPTKDIVIGSTAATHSLTVNGDLKVTGDVVYTGTENLRVKDKNIDLNVDDKGNAASTRADANGAGITVKATDGDVTLVYDHTKNAWTSNVPFDVKVGGTVDSAKTAETASKVAHTLKSGSGISNFTFDGSAEATVSVDDTYIQGIKVTAASNADTATTAGTASKTVGKLAAGDNVKFAGAGGQAVTEFDGSKNVTVSVDLTGVTGNITAIEEVVTALDEKVDANKTATDNALLALEGKINEKVGSITPGSAINVTGTTTAPTVSVKLAETQGNVQLDVTNGLKANLSADAALSTTSENPVQNKVVTEKINALWEKQFPISVTAGAEDNTYEFDGSEHIVTVNWTAINGTASAVSISDGTTSKPAGSGKNGSTTFTKSSQGTTTYTVTATIDGKPYKATVSANAYLPQFAGTSTAATAADLNITGLAIKRQNIKTQITVNAPTGEDKYIWFCVPSGVTISKVTSAGFGVNLKTVETKKATIGGKEYNYNCYRGVGLQTTAMTYVIS